MDWTRAKNKLVLVTGFMLSANVCFAQESLWKTVNDEATQIVPSYSGGLSPFPQKQKSVDEIEFEVAEEPTEIEVIESSDSLTGREKKLILTTSILAELKAFLSEESIFIPNLEGLEVEAIAKAGGKRKALIKGSWKEKGDEIIVSVDEARAALDLLRRLRDVDEQLAESVESAVIERTEGKGQEIVRIVEITEDSVILHDSTGQEYLLNFVRAPF